jgi:hypothetical protein
VDPTGTPASNRTRVVIALLIGAVGLVWVLQGLGVPIGGSFMVGDPTWTIIGGTLVAVAVGYAVWPRLRNRRGQP